MPIIDLEKTEEFINFLLKQIEEFKEDWYIENQEMQSINNELQNFKTYIENSPLVPYNIKSRIIDIEFKFDEVKQSRKQFFMNFLRPRYSDEAADSYKFKQRLDTLKIDLKNILRLINEHK